MSDKTTITIHRGYGNCADCGGYEWGYVSVVRNGSELMRKGWDSHLGADIQGPDYDISEFIREVLTAVDVVAEVVETDDV